MTIAPLIYYVITTTHTAQSLQGDSRERPAVRSSGLDQHRVLVTRLGGCHMREPTAGRTKTTPQLSSVQEHSTLVCCAQSHCARCNQPVVDLVLWRAVTSQAKATEPPSCEHWGPTCWALLPRYGPESLAL